jgi:cytochrome c
MRFYSPALVAAALALSSAAAQAQDLAAGEQSFKKCLPCHSVGDGATHKVGPQLNGLDGRKAGTAEGYSYSDANKESGMVWSEAVFKDYIQNPMGKIPGTKMAFPGIRNETEIGNLWGYLKQFGADGKIK